MASKLLTATACANHKTGILTDAASPGLRLEVSEKRQRKSWVYRYRMQSGVLKQIKLGEYPMMSLADARKAWAEQKALRDAMVDPRQVRKRRIEELREADRAAERGVYTADVLFADYIKHHLEKRGIKRRAELIRIIERDVLPRWRGRPANEITKADCVDLFEAVEERAPRVAEQMMSAVRGAFDLGAKRGRIGIANPAVGVGPMRRNDRIRKFDANEVGSIWRWLNTSTAKELTPNVRDVMRLSLLTACRSGEACGAEWSEVDLDAGVWTQPPEKTKNGREHRVMLSPQAVAILRKRQNVHPRWVFPSYRDKPILQKAIGFAQYLLRGGSPVADWTVHDLRRMALTTLGRLGCPRVVQDRVSNHVDRTMAAVYDQHPYDDEAREWLERLGNALSKTDPADSGKRRREVERARRAA